MTPSYAEEAFAYCKQKETEETVKKAKLEPCPFCGGEARILIYRGCGEALYSVACTDPRCIASEGRKYLDVTDAVKAWNRRD
jgi:hypothetical protein|nr:MAG TPA: restriction alleviation protein [Caudoviricetes sp.]